MTLLETVILSTVVVIEFSFATFFLLKWLVKNLKIEKPNVVVQNQTSPTQFIDDTKVDKKNLGPIEVGIKKSMIVDTKSDESSVKLDEKIKGKVKTQKDKLRSLRK